MTYNYFNTTTCTDLRQMTFCTSHKIGINWSLVIEEIWLCRLTQKMKKKKILRQICGLHPCHEKIFENVQLYNCLAFLYHTVCARTLLNDVNYEPGHITKRTHCVKHKEIYNLKSQKSFLSMKCFWDIEVHMNM